MRAPTWMRARFPMPYSVFLLSLCQALMMSATTLMITAAALVGFMLADHKALATLPLALQFFATMLTTIPASLFMGRFGRKAGFLLAGAIGTGGGVLATQGILSGDFWLFSAGALGVGIFNGFGNYYRFTAAELVDEDHRSRAIAYVLAGGVLAAFIGPNLAHWSEWSLGNARFAGSFAAVIGLYLLSMLIAVALRLPDPPKAGASGGGRPLGEIVAQPRFIAAVVSGMLGYGIMTFLMTATPLAMQGCALPLGDTALVIEWHVLGMFAPSFFTGHLIRRFGAVPIMLIGAAADGLSVFVNLSGQTTEHFWLALFLLGIGWNFLFIGATTLVTETYRPEEKAKAQAANDFLVFSTVTVASLSSGALLHEYGWRWVNLGVIPLLVVVVGTLLWLWRIQGEGLTRR